MFSMGTSQSVKISALIGMADGFAHERVVGAQCPPRSTPSSLDPHLGPRHLAGQLGDSARQVGAMRHDYDANHWTLVRIYR